MQKNDLKATFSGQYSQQEDQVKNGQTRDCPYYVEAGLDSMCISDDSLQPSVFAYQGLLLED